MERYCAVDRQFWEHASVTYCNLLVPAAYKNQSSLPFVKQYYLASRDAQPYLKVHFLLAALYKPAAILKIGSA